MLYTDILRTLIESKLTDYSAKVRICWELEFKSLCLTASRARLRKPFQAVRRLLAPQFSQQLTRPSRTFPANFCRFQPSRSVFRALCGHPSGVPSHPHMQVEIASSCVSLSRSSETFSLRPLRISVPSNRLLGELCLPRQSSAKLSKAQKGFVVRLPDSIAARNSWTLTAPLSS